MRTMFKEFQVRLRLFREEAQGAITVEAMLILPLLVWWYIYSFQFFDAFREKTVNIRASYTLADMVSREVEAVDKTYVEGLHRVFNYLTNSRDDTWIRVSSIYWDGSDKVFRVGWSCATGGKPDLNNASLQAQKDQIPNMPVGDTVILVETFAKYKPIFKVGLEDHSFDNFIVTRPRFTSQVALAEGASCVGGGGGSA